MPYLIIEAPIIQEAKLLKSSNDKKAVFRSVLQTADEVNRNKRMYPYKVLEAGMVNCQDRMRRRAFLGELDHPLPTGDSKIDGVRQTMVMLKEVSHIIREYQFDGNRLVGEIETTDTPNGRTFLGLLREKSGIGFSMRGMAELERNPEMNIVRAPLMVVTFDSVSMPSHQAAIVNFNEMNFESMSTLTENSNCGTICTPDGVCYLSEYFDKLVETKVIKFCKAWV